MPTTITLKNIPDEVYARLKSAAGRNRRSINSEAILCLEAVLMPGALTSDEHIARAREIRSSLGKAKFPAAEIDRGKREGRP